MRYASSVLIETTVSYLYSSSNCSRSVTRLTNAMPSSRYRSSCSNFSVRLGGETKDEIDKLRKTRCKIQPKPTCIPYHVFLFPKWQILPRTVLENMEIMFQCQTKRDITTVYFRYFISRAPLLCILSK